MFSHISGSSRVSSWAYFQSKYLRSCLLVNLFYFSNMQPTKITKTDPLYCATHTTHTCIVTHILVSWRTKHWKLDCLFDNLCRHITRKASKCTHYSDVILSTMASQITRLTIVYSTVYSRRRSKEISKLRVTGVCEVNSPVTAQGSVTRKMFPFDVVIMS